MIDKFKFFCMIFLALDADWDETHNEELGRFLSDANPFLFNGEVSAVRKVYDDFLEFVNDKKIDVTGSYDVACSYINHLNIPAVTESFFLLDRAQWTEALEEYLKG